MLIHSPGLIYYSRIKEVLRMHSIHVWTVWRRGGSQRSNTGQAHRGEEGLLRLSLLCRGGERSRGTSTLPDPLLHFTQTPLTSHLCSWIRAWRIAGVISLQSGLGLDYAFLLRGCNLTQCTLSLANSWKTNYSLTDELTNLSRANVNGVNGRSLSSRPGD